MFTHCLFGLAPNLFLKCFSFENSNKNGNYEKYITVTESKLNNFKHTNLNLGDFFHLDIACFLSANTTFQILNFLTGEGTS